MSQLSIYIEHCDIIAHVIDETKLLEEIKKISGQVIKRLFEQRKMEELVKHYTEDCKFIFLPENQTMLGRQGESLCRYIMMCNVTFIFDMHPLIL